MKRNSHNVLSRANGVVIAIGEKISWLYACIVVISFYEVLMRYAFNKPTVWVHESALALAGIAMIYGGLYAFAKNKHIAVSVIVDLLPKKAQAFFALFADIVALLYLVLLSLSVFAMTKLALFAPDGSIRLERTGSSWNSIFPAVVKLSMSATLVLFVALAAVHAYAKIAALRRGQHKN